MFFWGKKSWIRSIYKVRVVCLVLFFEIKRMLSNIYRHCIWLLCDYWQTFSIYSHVWRLHSSSFDSILYVVPSWVERILQTFFFQTNNSLLHGTMTTSHDLLSNKSIFFLIMSSSPTLLLYHKLFYTCLLGEHHNLTPHSLQLSTIDPRSPHNLSIGWFLLRNEMEF